MTPNKQENTTALKTHEPLQRIDYWGICKKILESTFTSPIYRIKQNGTYVSMCIHTRVYIMKL